ncbi:MAG TPA: D-hexose-6-phosphate mutarotase [Desulfocapsa sulfexigens]|nr:D-hexose-6-phosphate mutarotase [Desulfocapsa sulfexigens]
MITHKKTKNGFAYIEIVNKNACARVALQGAHLFHYRQQDKNPLLWLSEKSFFENDKAIRGGIPICWPWFGKHKTDPDLPQHGFARTSLWTLVETEEPDEFSTELLFQLENSPDTLKLWPHQFKLQLRVMVSSTLQLNLTTKNCSTESFEISSALHSYFAVHDIDTVFIEGLDNCSYFDALTKEIKTQKGNIYIREEIDRVYQNVPPRLTLHDQERSVQIRSQGSSSAVVWNPWIEKSARMGDMIQDAYKNMLCIETANALTDAQNIGPGDDHTVIVIIF